MSERRLTRNAARCMLCFDVIESKYTHDFVECGCGNLFVDGGLDYIRFGAKDWGSFEDLCEWEDGK